MKLTVVNGVEIDLATAIDGLQWEDSLSTAVIISLLTDRRANVGDRLPDGSISDGSIAPDRRGWCGDALADIQGDNIGSRLWLLEREKETEETKRRAIFYCEEALEWLLEDGIASSVEVTAEWSQPERLDVLIVITQIDGTVFNLGLNDITGEAYAV